MYGVYIKIKVFNINIASLGTASKFEGIKIDVAKTNNQFF